MRLTSSSGRLDAHICNKDGCCEFGYSHFHLGWWTWLKLKGYWHQFFVLILSHSSLSLLIRISWLKYERRGTQGAFFNLISFIAPAEQQAEWGAANGHHHDITLWKGREGDVAVGLLCLAETCVATRCWHVQELMHAASATCKTTPQKGTLAKKKFHPLERS